MPPLRRGARGRSPCPMGLPEVGAGQGDMASLAQWRGDGNPPAGAAGPVARLPLPPVAGTGGGWGALGRGPVPPVRHIPGSPRSPRGCEPQGPGVPRGLPVPGLAAPAAPQPLPLRRLRWCPTGRHGPQPAAGSGRGPRRASGGPRIWSRGPGRWPGCSGLQKSPGMSWSCITRHSWGGRYRPPRTTDCGVCACRLGSHTKCCARRRA